MNSGIHVGIIMIRQPEGIRVFMIKSEVFTLLSATEAATQMHLLMPTMAIVLRQYFAKGQFTAVDFNSHEMLKDIFEAPEDVQSTLLIRHPVIDGDFFASLAERLSAIFCIMMMASPSGNLKRCTFQISYNDDNGWSHRFMDSHFTAAMDLLKHFRSVAKTLGKTFDHSMMKKYVFFIATQISTIIENVFQHVEVMMISRKTNFSMWVTLSATPGSDGINKLPVIKMCPIEHSSFMWHRLGIEDPAANSLFGADSFSLNEVPGSNEQDLLMFFKAAYDPLMSYLDSLMDAFLTSEHKFGFLMLTVRKFDYASVQWMALPGLCPFAIRLLPKDQFKYQSQFQDTLASAERSMLDDNVPPGSTYSITITFLKTPMQLKRNEYSRAKPSETDVHEFPSHFKFVAHSAKLRGLDHAFDILKNRLVSIEDLSQ